jgi:two-component system response regulator NreC
MSKIRILLADDHALLRAGLKLLINHQHDMEVVAEAGDFAETMRLGKLVQPDVITLDLTMPAGNGIPMVERVRRECPSSRVLVVTMHDDPAYLRAALAAGAFGYVVKRAADTELLSAIRAVHAGRAIVDLKLRSGQTHAVLATKPAEDCECQDLPGESLSDRESTALRLLAEGHTNQAIADQLDLSVKTIESYRSRLLRKLGLRTRADIIRYAVELGLLGFPRDA